MLRSILRSLVRFLFKVLTKMDVQGLENIPRQGAAILAANHQGLIDSPLVFCLLERRDATALVADKYLKNPFLRWLVNAVGGIWINRESADFRALRTASEYLEAGGILGVAPEGTRSHTGGLIPAKTGIAYLAERSAAPIVPVAIWGTENAVSQLLHLRRPRVHLHVGKPFHLPPLERGDRSAGLQRNTDEIMCRIALMLPTSYWGVYKDHPRLLEMLSPRS